MASYIVKASVTGLDVGQTVTDEQLDKEHPGLGGAKRLLALKAIEPVAAKPAAPQPTEPPAAPKGGEGKKSTAAPKGGN